MKEIKYLIQNSKYIIPFLTGLSLLNITLFYSSFGIEIGSYISFDELFAPFINDIFYYAIFLSIIYLLIAIFLPHSWKVYFTNQSLENKNVNYWKRLKADLSKEGYWFLIMIVLFIIIIIQSTLKGNYGLIFLPLSFFLLHIRRELIIKYPELLHSSLEMLNLLLIMINLLIISLMFTFFDVYAIKNLPSKRVQINYGPVVIICKDSLAYVGRVKNYTFIYNKKSKSTLSLNNSDIKNVIFNK